MMLTEEQLQELLKILRKANSEAYENGVIDTLSFLGVPTTQLDRVHEEW